MSDFCRGALASGTEGQERQAVLAGRQAHASAEEFGELRDVVDADGAGDALDGVGAAVEPIGGASDAGVQHVAMETLAVKLLKESAEMAGRQMELSGDGVGVPGPFGMAVDELGTAIQGVGVDRRQGRCDGGRGVDEHCDELLQQGDFLGLMAVGRCPHECDQLSDRCGEDLRLKDRHEGIRREGFEGLFDESFGSRPLKKDVVVEPAGVVDGAILIGVTRVVPEGGGFGDDGRSAVIFAERHATGGHEFQRIGWRLIVESSLASRHNVTEDKVDVVEIAHRSP